NDPSPTPRIDSLTVSLRDLPARDAGFPYVALDPTVAAQTSRYILRGDRVGIIAISQAVVTNSPSTAGQAGTATVDLLFAAPLPPDGRQRAGGPGGQRPGRREQRRPADRRPAVPQRRRDRRRRLRGPLHRGQPQRDRQLLRREGLRGHQRQRRLRPLARDQRP